MAIGHALSRPTKILVYRLASGSLSLTRSDGAEEFEATLAAGYRVGEGLGGSSTIRVFGKPGTLGMTADAAVRAGVLTILTKDNP